MRVCFDNHTLMELGAWGGHVYWQIWLRRHWLQTRQRRHLL